MTRFKLATRRRWFCLRLAAPATSNFKLARQRSGPGKLAASCDKPDIYSFKSLTQTIPLLFTNGPALLDFFCRIFLCVAEISSFGNPQVQFSTYSKLKVVAEYHRCQGNLSPGNSMIAVESQSRCDERWPMRHKQALAEPLLMPLISVSWHCLFGAVCRP